MNFKIGETMKSVIFTLLLLLSFFSMAKAQEPLVFVTSDYPPYVIDNNGVATGMVPDIIRAIFKDSDIEVDIVFQPWNRGQASVISGAAFATFPYVMTRERAKVFDFSDPFLAFFPKFFYNKMRFPNGFSWKKLKDFQGYKMGGVRGFWYEADFQALRLNVNYVSTDLQNMNMLLKERVDFTLIDEMVGWHLIKTNFPHKKDHFAVAKKPESQSGLHLMISRKYPNAKVLTQVFNKGLKTIKTNGTYQKILNDYQVSEEYAQIPQDE
ncbi:substrate-binding periplasmic protein [Shewanella denitrificans]|nr:transporter substrate-binding domain-containing protein [Shewanella denitrificans]